ncbi:hypothetical protein [Pseudanabaena sp. BC1403]|uniref:hypothetical protein n=1 Tax=Pseudanabaena sp. BC1403 TaxID=2043171 RepID=UPI000CD885E4|nr:hypothetical protein [Pseudanabaena sp. BC1403]
MARGIARKDFDYEVDIKDSQGTVSVGARMLISMDKFNTGTADNKVKESTSTVVRIPSHITLSKNEREYGVHPRYALCEYADTAQAAACYGVTPKRLVEIPILTLAQFADLKEYDYETGGTQTKTTLIVNHSFDGSAGLTYRIKKLVNQVHV